MTDLTDGGDHLKYTHNDQDQCADGDPGVQPDFQVRSRQRIHLATVSVLGTHWMQSRCLHYLILCAPQNPNQAEHGSESDGKEDDSSVVAWFARQKAGIK